MKTTFSRIFLAFSVIFLAAMLLVGISFQWLTRSFLEGRAIDALKNNCSAISKVTAAYCTGEGLSDRDFFINLSVAAETSQADIVICDKNGKLGICSDAPLGCEHQGLSITNRDFLEQVLSQDYVVREGLVQGLYDEPRYVVSSTVRDPYSNEIYGIIIVSTPTAATEQVLKRLSDTYLFVSVLVLLAGVVVMTIYARKTSGPLRDMAKAAVAFGHGDLKARVHVSEDSTEEIRDLALAFNNMAKSLEKSEYQRKEFVTNVSHELKTPMTTIGGYVDGILDGTIPPQQQNRYLQIVSDETKRLSRLVRNMLEISRLQDQDGIPEEKKFRFDITESAGQVLLTFEQKINNKHLDVQVDMPEHPVFTYASEDAITQVIYNLMDNAVKFCPEGGVLGLTLRESKNKLYFTVFNDGETIPAQELPLLFDRFHKLDKSRGRQDGWGLGLYIAKTIICSHGEDISVSSKDGRTEFTFTLPLIN